VQKLKTPLIAALIVVIGAPLLIAHPTFAADANVTQVETFIRSVIKVVASLAGLIAAGFFVAGGFGYITSSGNPEALERSKHTLIYAAIGLAIVIDAFVISNIVTNLATSAFGS
jgi:hypothetical protein